MYYVSLTSDIQMYYMYDRYSYRNIQQDKFDWDDSKIVVTSSLPRTKRKDVFLNGVWGTG